MPKIPANKRPSESKKGKERRHHDDDYHGRDTPRVTYESTDGEGQHYLQPEQASQSPADQLDYSSQQQNAWASVQANFRSLSIGSPSRSNYTTDPPEPEGAAGYSPYNPTTSYPTASQATGSSSTSSYAPSGSASNYGGNQVSDAPADTTYDYPDPQAPTLSTHLNPNQTVAPTTYYSHTGHANSYGPSPEQPEQSRANFYADGAETAYPTTYATALPYATVQPQYYPHSTSQVQYIAQPYYNQPGPSTQQASNYPVQGPDRHVPKPGTIMQCGCLGCDVDGNPEKRPKLREGKDDHKKSASTRKKNSSSKRSESSTSKLVSTSIALVVQTATVDIQSGTMNCGALYLKDSDIKPWGKPHPPPPGSSREEERIYETLLKRWKEDSKLWRDTSCPCRFGYFNTDGHWVAGSYVRKYLKEGPNVLGATQPNPRWENNGWKAPEQPGPEKRD